MERTFTYLIDQNSAGLTVEWYLRGIGYSHHILTGLKKTADGICLNQERTYTNRKVQAGDLITVHLREEKGSDVVTPHPVPFRIVYEDEDILVVDKPADTPIHPSVGNYENTLANGVAWYFAQKKEPFVYRCINRLDRDTTGLIVLAKHALSGAILSAAMMRREIHRTYQAIVLGSTPDEGTINAPIGRLAGSVVMRTVDFAHGDPSVTHFRTLSRKNGFSHLELHLETGRTHQIRVHMAYLGFPLLGDTMYHPDGPQVIGRQALHSSSLTFFHPISGKKQTFHSALPADMKGLL